MSGALTQGIARVKGGFGSLGLDGQGALQGLDQVQARLHACPGPGHLTVSVQDHNNWVPTHPTGLCGGPATSLLHIHAFEDD